MVMLSTRLGQWVRWLFRRKASAPTPRQKRLAQLEAWERLCRMEPRLEELELVILASTPPRYMPAFWRGWRKWKLRMIVLAGWSAENPALRTSAAYDVAYRALWTAWETAAELTHQDGDSVEAAR